MSNRIQAQSKSNTHGHPSHGRLTRPKHKKPQAGAGVAARTFFTAAAAAAAAAAAVKQVVQISRCSAMIVRIVRSRAMVVRISRSSAARPTDSKPKMPAEGLTGAA